MILIIISRKIKQSNHHNNIQIMINRYEKKQFEILKNHYDNKNEKKLNDFDHNIKKD